MPTIVLTGGGTAGHVTPNIALLPKLRELGYDIHYIGSYNGIEKGLIEAQRIPYYGIDSGKLRRYRDIKNLTDPGHVIHGYGEARSLIKKIKPDIVFSKGGYVTVPVVMAAARYRIPTIIHESDLTPGLANKMCFPAASKICCNFPETMKYLPENKRVLTGCPIRAELLEGDAERGRKILGFDTKKPIVMVIGGSLGSVAVNGIVRKSLPRLLKKYQVLHICGRGNTDEVLNELKGYRQFAYVGDDLKDFFAAADVVISRAGANAICEILALHKPNILIPLGGSASRGDQVLNAKSFQRQGLSEVLMEDTVTESLLCDTIDEVYSDRADWAFRMEASQLDTGVSNIIHLIKKGSKLLEEK
ncbi:MAG: undecaprenyldiphospho-muramoylpentapeptide beta-N-acetylglucosaminyltransferase [Lachnospiraceae bacterium]|nr:undecaprenyldiphospho-muramoylpentapeptide beta-N-acetylglucosaminyltransferase [Candidatus Darwinimomas equi]